MSLHSVRLKVVEVDNDISYEEANENAVLAERKLDHIIISS